MYAVSVGLVAEFIPRSVLVSTIYIFVIYLFVLFCQSTLYKGFRIHLLSVIYIVFDVQ